MHFSLRVGLLTSVLISLIASPPSVHSTSLSAHRRAQPAAWVPQPPPAPSERLAPLARFQGQPAGKAAVLLPFATLLNEGPNAGNVEINTLRTAGFQVDVFRDQDVTLDVIAHLAVYSVVYMETHSGEISNGDDYIIVHQIADTANDKAPFQSLYNEKSISYLTIAGDPGGHLWVGFDSKFVTNHMDTFPNGNIFYLDGCNILKANLFWAALQSRNITTLISWDNDVDATSSEAAAPFMFQRLGQGNSVQDSFAAAQAAGLAVGFSDHGIAHLGVLGDGTNTLARALAGTGPPATATPTPGATSTATPTPSPTPVSLYIRAKLAHKALKAGRKQTISVQTLPGAAVSITVTYPNRKKVHHKGKADAKGLLSWVYKQPAGVTRGSNHLVHIVLTASQGTGTVAETTRTYRIV
jgi:hypothetical protein